MSEVAETTGGRVGVTWTQRPYLCGLNNPRSPDPGHALYPHDETSAGYRLWDMVNSVRPIRVEDWLACTQRVNLLSDTTLPKDYRGAAGRRGRFLAPLIQNRVVVLLGSDVADAVGHEAEPLVWHGSWVTIPHPSGRNRLYNDYVYRLSVGLLLWDVLRYCGVASEG